MTTLSDNEALKPRQGSLASEPSATKTTDQKQAPKELSKKELMRCMQNRELSWLRFNERVLEEAGDLDNPLFERLNFLNIFTTNLDEFFMVRVGSFQDIARSKETYYDGKTGMSATQLLAKIFETVACLYPLRDSYYARVEEDLTKAGFKRRLSSDLTADEISELTKHYQMQIAPVLAPQVVDKTHPFPHLENKRLIIALSLERNPGKNADKEPDLGAEKKIETVFGMIPLPNDVERIYFFSDGGYILLEDILLHFSEKLFKKYTILEKAVISVTRNADLDTLDEQFDIDEDYLAHMTKLVKRRKRMAPVRLEIEGDDLKKLPEYLCKRLNLEPEQVFYCKAPLDLRYHTLLCSQIKPEVCEQLHFTPFEPVVPAAATSPAGMFARLREGDVMLFHPYESLQPYLSLIKEASEDKSVLSIQITLYRLANNSRLVEHLIAAVENGKRVVVFIELRARMDEENNIDWALRLEEAGCSVFYGQLDYKMHAKITLITRRQAKQYEHFVHIGTGNYNESTIKQYTDISLMTMNEEIAMDAISVFQNMLVGSVEESYPCLWVAPQDFKPGLIELIGREAALGKAGKITIKANSITDTEVIVALINASRAGTQIDIILRGICCLVPGIEGYTENISIRSIVGRFLEHPRIYCFGAGDNSDLYMGSGDMMTRNTTRRIELFAPIYDAGLRARIFELFEVQLSDTVKARLLTSDGEYIKIASDGPAINSQQFYIDKAQSES